MTGHRRRGTSGLEPLRGVSPQQPCDNRRSMGSDPGQFRRRLPAPPIPLYHGSQETSSAPDQGDSETGTGKDEKDGEGRGRRQGRRWKNEKEWRRDEKATKGRGGRRRDGQKREGDERTKEDGGGTGVRPRSRSSRAVTRLARRLDSLVRESNEPARFAFGRFGSMQGDASIDAGGCKHMQASMQERCGAGVGAMLHRCRRGVSIHAFRGEGDFPRRQFHCITGVKKRAAHPTRATARQRITARRGGKRGVRGEMRGIVRRVPTCGAFRCAAGGRREDEEDEEDYGERRQRRGIVRRVPTCGAVRRRRLRPIRVRCSFLDSRGTMKLAAREAVAEVAFPPRKAWIETNDRC